MNSNYVAKIQSACRPIPDEQLVSVNMYPSTCIWIQVARPEYMYPGDMWPGVNAA